MSGDLFDELAKLALHRRRLEAGATLFRAGDPVASLFLVIEGSVCLVRYQAQGLRLTLQRASAPSFLAEASLFADRYHCDALAIAPSAVLAIPRGRAIEAFAERSGLAQAWSRHLALEVQRARGRAEALSLRTVAERLDAWLLLTDETLPPRGHWRLLADEIGVSPAALYRELARRRRSSR